MPKAHDRERSNLAANSTSHARRRGLTPSARNTRFVPAYAVHPLIGGGVAEWLKAAVC